MQKHSVLCSKLYKCGYLVLLVVFDVCILFEFFCAQMADKTSKSMATFAMFGCSVPYCAQHCINMCTSVCFTPQLSWCSCFTETTQH